MQHISSTSPLFHGFAKECCDHDGIVKELRNLRGLTVGLPTAAGWVRPVNEVSTHWQRRGAGVGGGIRQRAMIAIALAARPTLLFADELTIALGVSVGAQVLLLLQELQRELGLTYVLISHSLPVVAQMATHIAIMRAGQFVVFGSARLILDHGEGGYTKELVAAVPEIPRMGQV